MDVPRHDAVTDREALQDLLARHDIAATAQRLDIAAVLFERHHHLSADEVLRRVNAAGGSVSKATVYNTLGLFADKGLVRQVVVDPARVFYDSNLTPHQHLFNVTTGELRDITGARVDLRDLPRLPKGTVFDGVDVVVRIRAEGPLAPDASKD